MASITVKPGILKWARETYGLSVDDVLTKIGVKPDLLKKWEAGEAPISMSRLKYLANLYKRPLSTFFLPSAPDLPAFPPDFRTLDSVKSEDLSPKVRLAIRRANRNRKILAEVTELLDEKVKKEFRTFSHKSNPEEVASSVRRSLGVTVDHQQAWTDKADALKQWIKILELNGILVSQTSLPFHELRAFCLRGSNLPPAIVLNTKDVEAGRIFSLWHEFGHLLVPHSEIVELNNNKSLTAAHKVVEVFANAFAAAFLVPASALKEDKLFNDYKETREDRHLQRIAARFRVSQQVILRRMHTLGAIDSEFFNQKRVELDNAAEAYRKSYKEKERDAEDTGFQSPGSKAFQSAGLTLTSKLFEAQTKGKINSSDLASYFEVKTSHFKEIQKLLNKRLT